MQFMVEIFEILLKLSPILRDFRFAGTSVICLIIALDVADKVGWCPAALIIRDAPKDAAQMTGCLYTNQPVVLQRSITADR
jgi:hypothetical protein